MKVLATLLILLTVSSINHLPGQNFSAFYCPVEFDGKNLKYPWTGGFNSPQVSKGDLNGDGVEELFVFDRGGNVPMIFEYEGGTGSTAYNFRPDLKPAMPDSLVSWALMRDYNRDGIADLFVAPTFGGFSSVQLYVGSINNGELSFEIKQIGNEPDRADIIWYRLGSIWVNVSTPFTDIPDVIDIDGDSDLDIVSFDQVGSFVTYYRNLQVEEGLPADEMQFEVADFCWGKFKEAGTDGQLFLSDNPNECANGATGDDGVIKGGGAHAGSTVMCFDNDDDGDFEMMIGDLSSRNLAVSINGGTPDEAFITDVIQRFPTNDLEVDMDVFLGSFNVDVDGDGLKDILAAPNGVNSVQNVDNLWLYRNTGNPTNKFNFIQKDFLAEETIDLGSLSVPVFMDENQDGLMDLLVATGGEYSSLGINNIFLYLFRNVGTETAPSFILIDDDYLDFNEFSNSSTNPSPTVGDIDGDGDIDLLIGDSEGNLYLFLNRAEPGAAMDFGNPLVEYMDIDLGNRGRPAIYDVNADGLSDIVVGERNVNGNFQDPNNPTFGSVAYYQNIGSIGNPQFNPNLAEAPNNPALGQMRSQLFISNAEANSSAPHFITIDGELQILLGSQAGRIKRYLVDQPNLNSKFPVIDSIMGGIDEGSLSTLSTYDIDNDGFLEMVVGNLRGGLSFFNTTLLTGQTSVDNTEMDRGIAVFPNPVEDQLSITIPAGLAMKEVVLYSSTGQKVMDLDIKSSQSSITDLAAGLYILVFDLGDEIISKKIVKI